MATRSASDCCCEWNDTAAAVPDISVPGLVEQWAAATPEAPAVVFEDTTVSYRELHERSVRQARWLVASGDQPGDIVAVALPRSEQLLVVLLAIMRTGAAYLPLKRTARTTASRWCWMMPGQRY